MRKDNTGCSPPSEGQIKQYVEKHLFGETIDSLGAHTNRKAAIGNPYRYSVLYLLYNFERLRWKELAQATGKEGNALQHHLRELLRRNLIAEVPTPSEEDGRNSYYRITKLGIQEIEADIRNITGDSPIHHKFIESGKNKRPGEEELTSENDISIQDDHTKKDDFDMQPNRTSKGGLRRSSI